MYIFFLTDLYTSRYYMSQPYQADILQNSEYNRKVSQSLFNMSAAMTKENGTSIKYVYKPKQHNQNKQNRELIYVKSARINHRRGEDYSQPWDASSRRYSHASSAPLRPLPPLPQESKSEPSRQIPIAQYVLQVSHAQLSHHSQNSPPTFRI